MTLAGWIGWLLTGGGIAALDLALMHYKHTSLSDTWLQHAHNRYVRPLEAAVYVALGAHLFYGTPISTVIVPAAALIPTVALSLRKRT